MAFFLHGHPQPWAGTFCTAVQTQRAQVAEARELAQQLAPAGQWALLQFHLSLQRPTRAGVAARAAALSPELHRHAAAVRPATAMSCNQHWLLTDIGEETSFGQNEAKVSAFQCMCQQACRVAAQKPWSAETCIRSIMHSPLNPHHNLWQPQATATWPLQSTSLCIARTCIRAPWRSSCTGLAQRGVARLSVLLRRYARALAPRPAPLLAEPAFSALQHLLLQGVVLTAAAAQQHADAVAAVRMQRTLALERFSSAKGDVRLVAQQTLAAQPARVARHCT